MNQWGIYINRIKQFEWHKLPKESQAEIPQTYFQTIWDSVKNPARTFTYAFFQSDEEELFLEHLLPKELYHYYNDEREIVKDVASYQRRTARFNMIEKVRDLQDNLRLPNFSWQFPPRNVLKGEHISIPKEGPFQLLFDNGSVAMEGEYKDKMRSGMWSHFYSNGQVMAQGIYNMDEKEDIWEFFYADGKVRSKGRYFQNLKEGEWIERDKNGIETILNYTKGQLKKY